MPNQKEMLPPGKHPADDPELVAKLKTTCFAMNIEGARVIARELLNARANWNPGGQPAQSLGEYLIDQGDPICFGG